MGHQSHERYELMHMSNRGHCDIPLSLYTIGYGHIRYLWILKCRYSYVSTLKDMHMLCTDQLKEHSMYYVLYDMNDIIL